MYNSFFLEWTTTFTGLVYIPFTTILAYISFRYFKLWRNEPDSYFYRILFYLFVILTLISLTGALSGTYFARSIPGIRLMLILSSFFLSIGNGLLTFIFFKESNFKVSPNLGFLVTFTLGLAVTYLTIVVPIHPYVEEMGGVNWGMPDYLDYLRVSVYLIGIIPFLLLVIKKFSQTSDVSEKKHFLLLIILFSEFLLIVIADFIIEPLFDYQAFFSEVMIIIASILSIAAYITTYEFSIVKIEGQYRLLLKNLHELILIINSDGTIKYAGDMFKNHLKYNPSDLLEKSILDIIHEADRQLVTEHFRNAKAGSQGTNFEFRFIDAENKPLWVESTGNFIPVAQFSKTYNAYLLACHDISDRKNAEEKLIKAKEKAEESDRLKTEFLAQVSHEIRTPINVIINSTQFLKEDLQDFQNSNIQASLTAIENNSNRITRTIDLILDMSLLQTNSYIPKFRNFDLWNDLIQKLISEFRPIAQLKGIALIANNLAKETIIHADIYAVLQILKNLIDNAIKYTDSGKVSIIVRSDQAHLSVEISDTGIGIAKEFLPNLFTPFRQEYQGFSRPFEGNGLGLAIVKKFCELNNAKIEVESEKNKGSKFTVTFPLNQPKKK